MIKEINLKKVLLVVIAFIYVISPIDLLPGILVDDLIVMLCTCARVKTLPESCE